MKITRIEKCRCCGNEQLEDLFSLGVQALTGVFPRSENETVPVGPLELVKCHGDSACGLVQLRHSYEADKMYGSNYGYRSGLNSSMVSHLKAKAELLQKINPLQPGDLVLDIGSNDGTSLSFYPTSTTRVGMDPTIVKFRDFYQGDINPIADFFSLESFRNHYGDRKAKIISSIAMFYDLEDPMKFVADIAGVLADDGVWHFEQSYMPLMLKKNAYDTICHEHVEYYALYQIKWMLDRSGLKIIDVELNDTNGGSFAVTACKKDAEHNVNSAVINAILQEEAAFGLNTLTPFEEFKIRVFNHRDELRGLINSLKKEGKKITGYGASTKGNVLLQFCGFTREEIPEIADVNTDKHGSFTPGTLIPIVSEQVSHNNKPDYFLVLPWHFRENLLKRESEFLQKGGKMIFPLPEIAIVGA